MRKLLSGILLLTVGLLPLHSPGQHLPTEEDFQRAELFYRDNIKKHVFYMVEQIHWFKDQSGFAYKVNTQSGERYFTVTTADRKKEPAFDPDRLADSLQRLVNRKVDGNRISVNNPEWENKSTFLFSAFGTRFIADLTDYSIIRLERRREIKNTFPTSVSPDWKYRVSIQNSNLHLKDVQSGNEIQLTEDGTPTYIYGSSYGWSQIMEGEGTPPVPNITVQWSPDNKKFLTQIMDARDADKMYLLNWSVDTLYKPVLLSYYRGSPGDTNIIKYIPVIFDVQSGKMVRIDLPWIPHFMSMEI